MAEQLANDNPRQPLSEADRLWYLTVVRQDLTARELEVLAHLAHGRSDLEIAAKLSISEATVSNHCNRILSKMYVRSRGKAAAIARELGIVIVDIDEILHDILSRG